MKLFFIDDSSVLSEGLYGHGGIVVDEGRLRLLSSGLRKVKKAFRIPQSVELKWSPGRDHYLRTRFKGTRQKLYSAALDLLPKIKASCVCSIHHLSECHGIKLHGWSLDRAKDWAAKQQTTFLAERFQDPLLSRSKARGIMVMDRMSNLAEEEEVIRALEFDLLHGTRYHKLKRIGLNLLTADSSLCPPLEVADIVIGITVGWIGTNKYAEELFPKLLRYFLRSDYGTSKCLAASPSAVIFGYGLKLFPRILQRRGRTRFKNIDQQYTYSSKGGFKKRKRARRLRRRIGGGA